MTDADVQPLDALAPLLTEAAVLDPMSGLCVDEALLARAPRLRLVPQSSTGHDYTDRAAAARRGIPVCYVPGTNALSAAEHVFRLVLALYRRLISNHLGIVAGEYAAANRRDMAAGIYDLHGKTLGSVGFGRIGRQVARRAIPFELTTLYCDIVRPEPTEAQTCRVRYAPLPELLATVDILTVHVPLEPATYHLFGDAELALMKLSAMVINTTARGPLVDPAALAARVADGRLAPPDAPLVRLAASGGDRLVLTTHLAGVTHEAGQRSIQRAFASSARLARGEPLQAVVNGVAAPQPAVAPSRRGRSAMEATEVSVRASEAVAQLLACGITHVVWLPDSESSFLYQALVRAEAAGQLRVVPICREGEAIPLALGLLMGGQRPAIIIQNTGFFEAGDSLRGQALDFGLPLLLLIGYRGWHPDRAQMTDTAAIYLEPVLRAYGVPFYLLDSPAALPLIPKAYAEAQARRGPVAVLIAGEWE